MNKNPYGDILLEIESGLWEHDYRVEEGIAESYEYTDPHFRACLKIFMEGFLCKILENMKDEKDNKKKADAVQKAGEALRKIILEFTGIDPHELHKS